MAWSETASYDVGVVLWSVVFAIFLLRRVQIRRGRPHKVLGGAGAPLQVLRPGALLGLLLSIPHPAGAHERRPPLPSRPKVIASDPPGVRASRDLPESLLAGPGTSPPWESTDGEVAENDFPSTGRVDPWDTSVDRDGRRTPRTHPAIHGKKRGGGDVTPLFPRATKDGDPQRGPSPGASGEQKERAEQAERLACMRRHPSGKAQASARNNSSTCRHIVVPGDTLWDLAAAHLQTDDLRRIARFWPKIHRQNRDLVGADPNLLLPGQVLVIPAESE